MTHLEIGDKAPDFSGINQDGEVVSLNDYKGKKLVLFFYPKASTPGCTAEACNLSDNIAVLRERGYEVLGVSADSPKRQQNFKTKYDFQFPLMADEEKEIINAFGVWGKKKMYGREYEGIYRETFLIDEEGIITHIFKKVKTKDHTQQIIDALDK